MIIEFRKLAKEDKDALDPFFRARYYENSHFNFTTCYMWRELFDFQWTIEDGVLFLVTKWQGQPMVLQQIGRAHV